MNKLVLSFLFLLCGAPAFVYAMDAAPAPAAPVAVIDPRINAIMGKPKEAVVNDISMRIEDLLAHGAPEETIDSWGTVLRVINMAERELLTHAKKLCAAALNSRITPEDREQFNVLEQGIILGGELAPDVRANLVGYIDRRLAEFSDAGEPAPVFAVGPAPVREPGRGRVIRVRVRVGQHRRRLQEPDPARVHGRNVRARRGAAPLVILDWNVPVRPASPKYAD